MNLEHRYSPSNLRIQTLNRKTNDYLKEIAELRTKNQNLEMEMSKVARVGKKEEVSFAEEAQTWPGIWLSEKFKKHGDYLLAFRDLSGQPLDPKLLIDNKDRVPLRRTTSKS